MENLELLTLDELKQINGGEPTLQTSFGYDTAWVIGSLFSSGFWEGWVMDTFH